MSTPETLRQLLDRLVIEVERDISNHLTKNGPVTDALINRIVREYDRPRTGTIPVRMEAPCPVVDDHPAHAWGRGDGAVHQCPGAGQQTDSYWIFAMPDRATACGRSTDGTLHCRPANRCEDCPLPAD